MRADDRRRPRHRHHQAPAPGDRRRRRRDDRDRRARPRPRSPECAAEAARPLVPGRRLDGRAGHDRRHGRQQLVWLTLDPLRQHGPQRARHPRPPGRRRRARLRPRRRRHRPCRRRCRLRARTRGDAPRRDRGALAEGAAPGRRLQPRPLRSAEREALHERRQRQPRSPARRRRRHAGLVARANAEAGAAAGREGAWCRQFPDLSRRDGGGPAHRHARADGGRARRPHDDRLGARQPGVRADDGGGADRRTGRDPARRVRR